MTALDHYDGQHVRRAMTALFGGVDSSDQEPTDRRSRTAAADRIAELVTHLRPAGVFPPNVHYVEQAHRPCIGPGKILVTAQSCSDKGLVAPPEMASAASPADFKKCEKVILKMRNGEEKNASGYAFSIPVIINFNYHG